MTELPTPNILIINHLPEDILAIRCLLRDCGSKLIEAKCASTAIRLLKDKDFAAIIIHPECISQELLLHLDSNLHNSTIPPAIFCMQPRESETLNLVRRHRIDKSSARFPELDRIVLRQKIEETISLIQMKNLLEMNVNTIFDDQAKQRSGYGYTI